MYIRPPTIINNKTMKNTTDTQAQKLVEQKKIKELRKRLKKEGWKNYEITSYINSIKRMLKAPPKKEKAKKDYLYTCQVCGKPADYNLQNVWQLWSIEKDDFISDTPDDTWEGESNEFFCEKHYHEETEK